MSRHARRSSPLSRILVGVATFAVLGLGAWSGINLRSPDDEISSAAPVATIPSTLPTQASVPLPPAPSVPAPTTAPPQTTTPPAPPPTTQAAPPPVDSGVVAFEQQVVELVNSERATAGCAALTVDNRLAIAARAHSADMAARGYFDHTTPDGVTFDERIDNAGYSWSFVAENIARGQRNPAAVMSSWMNSDGHRRNILNCDLRQIGVGLAYDANNSPHWTQDFGTPR